MHILARARVRVFDARTHAHTLTHAHTHTHTHTHNTHSCAHMHLTTWLLSYTMLFRRIEYAQVTKMLGNGRLEALCFDGVKRLCHIRGKLRKKVRSMRCVVSGNGPCHSHVASHASRALPSSHRWYMHTLTHHIGNVFDLETLQCNDLTPQRLRWQRPLFIPMCAHTLETQYEIEARRSAHMP